MLRFDDSNTFWKISRKHLDLQRAPQSNPLRPNGDWDRLPAELVVKIFEELSAVILVHLSGVCRKFRAVICDSLTLNYKIKCLIAGVEDGGVHLYSLSDRCERLHRWTEGWKSMHQRWPNGPSVTIARTNEVDISCDGALLVQVSHNAREMSLSRLPSESRDIPSETWRLPSFSFEIETFSHDHTQGLLVLVEPIDARTLHIHLVSERTGLAHPWASKPIIDVHFHEDLGTTLCVVDVHGCFLSVLFAGDDAAPPSHKNHMRVYNWKLGILVKMLDSPRMENSVMLDDRHILVPADLPMCEGPCLVLLDCFRGEEEGIDVDIEAHNEAILMLQLPRLKYPSTYKMIEIWSSLASPNRARNIPFTVSPSSGILAIHVTINTNDGAGTVVWGRGEPTLAHTFIVPVSVFLSRLKAVKADQDQFLYHAQDEVRYPRPVTVLPWALWGQDARLLPQSSCIKAMCNSRALIQETVDGHKVIAIYDFATIPSLLKDIHSLDGDSGNGLHSIPAPFDQGPSGVLETRVLSAAPLRRVVTDFTRENEEEFLLYEDGVCVFIPGTNAPINVYSL